MATPEGFAYIPEFLAAEDQDALLDFVQDLDYTHDFFHGRPMKRAWAQFGFAYVATGQKLTKAPAMSAELQALTAKAAAHYPADAQFNQCIVTHYPPGAGIGWHADASFFSDCIIAVSLGAPARLQFRPKGTASVACEIQVAPGSLYVLRGPARWDWQHQVVPVKTTRYSLTFRYVSPAAAMARTTR